MTAVAATALFTLKLRQHGADKAWMGCFAADYTRPWLKWSFLRKNGQGWL
jgi:hypothetical protein